MAVSVHDWCLYVDVIRNPVGINILQMVPVCYKHIDARWTRTAPPRPMAISCAILYMCMCETGVAVQTRLRSFVNSSQIGGGSFLPSLSNPSSRSAIGQRDSIARAPRVLTFVTTPYSVVQACGARAVGPRYSLWYIPNLLTWRWGSAGGGSSLPTCAAATS